MLSEIPTTTGVVSATASPTAQPTVAGPLPRADESRWLRAAFLTAAAAGMGFTLQQSNGTLDPIALDRLTVTLFLTVAGVAIPRITLLERFGKSVLPAVMAAGLALIFGSFFVKGPANFLKLEGPNPLLIVHAGVTTAAVLAGALIGEQRWFRHVAFVGILAMHAVLGVWTVLHVPSPFIDVDLFQRNAIAELLAGRNPFEMTFPNIYGNDNTPFYGPGLSVGGTLRFGFIYPPGSLLLATLGHVIAGDYRYAQVAATTVAGALIGYARPGRTAKIAAVLFLFTPRILYVLERGWTEPFAVLLLAATVFTACRFPRALPYVLALFLTVKQYFVLAVPLVFLLLPRPLKWRPVLMFVSKTTAVAVVLNLPFILWGPKGFMKSVVFLQMLQPFRKDALSYAAWIFKEHAVMMPTWIAFAVALVVIALTTWRNPRTPGGFASAVALTFVCFFALNKQAFCNYYFFIVGALSCALAAQEGSPSPLAQVAAEPRSVEAAATSVAQDVPLSEQEPSTATDPLPQPAASLEPPSDPSTA